MSNNGTDRHEGERKLTTDSGRSSIWGVSEVSDLVVSCGYVRTFLAQVHYDCRIASEPHLHTFSPGFTAPFALHIESTPCEVLTQLQEGECTVYTGTPGREEYDRINVPAVCPACSVELCDEVVA